MTRLIRHAIWSGVAMALASAGVAHAQQSQSGAESASSGQIEEIIVTAARVEESLQTTALAIQAVTADDLLQKGAVNPTEVAKLVPGLTINPGSFTVINFRGLGGQTATGFAQSSFGVYVDGVALSQVQAFHGNFFDIQRLEVLKGPQGTLYGRNASSGAMNVITRDPGREVEGNVNVELGTFNLASVNGSLSLPLSDTFAMRGAVYSYKNDGYFDDHTDRTNQLNGRLKALWTPNEDLRVLLAYSLTDVEGGGGISSPRPPPLGDYWLGPTNPAVIAVAASAGAPPANPASFTEIINRMAYATVDWNLGFANLTFIPAYVWGNTCNACQGSILPNKATQARLGNHLDTDQRSLELRLAHVGERVKYVTGLYALSDKVDMQNLFYPNTSQGASDQDILLESKSWAGFGEMTYGLTDTFRVIGGVRYTKDDKEMEGDVTQSGPQQVIAPGRVVCADPTGVLPSTFCRSWRVDSDASFHRTTWKAGAEYDLSPSSFLFATVGTGYKTGIFFPSPGPANLARPEFITAYTVGAKNRFLDNTLQVNGELFYWKFKDQQISAVGVDASGSLNFITFNAGRSTIYGATVDVLWRATPRDTFRAMVEYDHAYYDEYVIPSPLPTSFAPGSTGGGCPVTRRPGGLLGVTLFANCSDQRMANTPKWSGNAGYGHDFTVGSGGTLHADVSARFNSRQYIQQDWSGFLAPDGAVLSQMSGYMVWDAFLEYSLADRPWSVALWGRNLGDKIVYTSASTVAGATSGLQAPRTYGLRVNVNF